MAKLSRLQQLPNGDFAFAIAAPPETYRSIASNLERRCPGSVYSRTTRLWYVKAVHKGTLGELFYNFSSALAAVAAQPKLGLFGGQND